MGTTWGRTAEWGDAAPALLKLTTLRADIAPRASAATPAFLSRMDPPLGFADWETHGLAAGEVRALVYGAYGQNGASAVTPSWDPVPMAWQEAASIC